MERKSFVEALQAVGLRATHPRLHVLRVLHTAAVPLSVDDIVEQSTESLDRVTVYRCLEALAQARLVRQVDLRKNHSLYELFDEHDHHHIVCTSCGVIENFVGCDVAALSESALRRSTLFSNINDHALELFGVCNSCTT
jgi:Fur family transcriptional regulator, ferric uptake regulator